ncbi:MAG TPA: glycosyltransferase family 4 protein [Stellaceae bacterium]|nr:glycosyltransferase family 4 protein [Stellaceae bacterium]
MRDEDSIAPTSAEGRPPAVLQVVPSLVSGGVERGTIEIAGALAAAGWRSCVASAGGPMVRELARAGAEHVELPLASKNPITICRNGEALGELIERLGIDIVHARSRAPAWSAWRAVRMTGRRFVTTFHNVYPTDLPFKRHYNAVMARGDRVIAISHFVAEHAARTYGIGDERLRTIHRGVDMAIFDPAKVGAERVAALARQWRVPDGAPVVMLPGRLTRWKGSLDLIAAVARLGRRDLCVVLVGEPQRGGFRRELERTIARSGIGEAFRIVEGCRDMAAAYMLADVVVSASADPEGFGRVIVEAQAMGRPVVATDHGGARETVIPGETGWLARPRDPDSLAAALAHALALDAEARARYARRAIAHVAAAFTRERMCAETLAVYEELLPRKILEAAAPATARYAVSG